MWVLVLLFSGVVVYLAWAKKVEGMSPTASELNLMQVGEIKKLDEELTAFTLTQAVVDDLQKCVDTNIENTSTLQATLGQSDPNSLPNAYPEEP